MAKALVLWALVSSAIGILLATGGFITFCFTPYRNLFAGTFALCSGIYAGIVCLLSYLRLRNRTSHWYSEENFICFRLFAVIGMSISFSLMIFYIFMHVYFKRAVLPVQTSYLIPSVWAFITLKWSIALYCTTRRFHDDGAERRLITNES